MQITGNWDKQYREDTKRLDSIKEATVKCRCGHSVLLGRKEKKICSHCGKWVFKSEKDEFIYRMEHLL